MNANAFEQLAEKQIPAPRARRLAAAEKRALGKALGERDRAFRLWLKWHREQRDQLLAGPHGAAARELTAFLETMTAAQGSKLIALVERGPWRGADADTQYHVLRMIDFAIAHLNERAGKPPFNDALPFSDEPPTAFERIRGLLT